METQHELLPSSLRTWLQGLAELLLVFAPALLLISIMREWVAQDSVRGLIVVWVANILMLAMVWLAMKLRDRPWRELGLTFAPVRMKKGLQVFGLSLLVFIIGTGAFLFGSTVFANIHGIPESADFSRYDFLKDNPWGLVISLAGVWIVSSFGEEVIYRAFLIQILSEIMKTSKFGRAIAVILSSVIFGSAHYEWGLLGMIQTGCMGLAMGVCYLKLGKRLWILVLAHAYMDTILLVQLYLASN